MTSIVTHPYSPQINQLVHREGQVPSRQVEGGVHTRNNATNVTLSPAAKVALGAESISTVISKAQDDIKNLLADTGKTSLLENNQLSADLSGFDRRGLFAISSNIGGEFSVDEQKAASIELQQRLDQVLSGAVAVGKMSGDYGETYHIAAQYLEKAGPEEKATTSFKNQKSAMAKAMGILRGNPAQSPGGILHDPVSDYLARSSSGQVAEPRDFAQVAHDVRTQLDRQLNGSTNKTLDLSRFGGRSLSAISLNNGNRFTSQEVHAAKGELKSRIGNSVQEVYRSSSSSSDVTAFTKNLIAQYQSLSSEERQAVGFTDDYYDSLVQNYNSFKKIETALQGGFGVNGSGGTGKIQSLLDFL